MTRRASLAGVGLLALVLAGCFRQSRVASTASQKIPDLGVIEVCDGIESRHDLGGGKVCVITPAFQKNGAILLAMTFVETNSTGASRILAHMNASTFPDHPVEVQTSAVGVEVTPHITDLALLTREMKKVTSEPVIQFQKLDGNFIRYVVQTGSAAAPHHYVATWYASQWRINRLVK